MDSKSSDTDVDRDDRSIGMETLSPLDYLSISK